MLARFLHFSLVSEKVNNSELHFPFQLWIPQTFLFSGESALCGIIHIRKISANTWLPEKFPKQHNDEENIFSYHTAQNTTSTAKIHLVTGFKHDHWTPSGVSSGEEITREMLFFMRNSLVLKMSLFVNLTTTLREGFLSYCSPALTF